MKITAVKRQKTHWELYIDEKHHVILPPDIAEKNGGADDKFWHWMRQLPLKQRIDIPPGLQVQSAYAKVTTIFSIPDEVPEQLKLF